MSNKPALIQAVENGDVEITVSGPSGTGKEAVLSVIETFILAFSHEGVRFIRENRLGRPHTEHTLYVGLQCRIPSDRMSGPFKRISKWLS